MNRFLKYASSGLVIVVAACAGASKQEPEKVSLTFQAQLDSGNASYRRGDFKSSAKFFYQATKTEPENLSGWYGVYMAESRLGNTDAAAKAKEVVAKQAPAMPVDAHDSLRATTKENPHE